MKTRKHKDLTVEEVRGRVINPLVLAAISEIEHVNGVGKEGICILDWGCGRGAAVAKFREMGYTAYGVDIDPKVISKSKGVFQLLFPKSEKCLFDIGIENHTPFASGKFHLIITEHVLEHVADISSMLREVSRLLVPGGLFYGVFPSGNCPIEPHLRMPLVHWLPKNRWMKNCMRVLLLLGFSPRWDIDPGERPLDVYANYMINKVFYRSLRTLRREFEAHRLVMEVVTQRNNTVRRMHQVFPISLIPLKVLSYLISRFWIVHIIARKQ